MIKFQNVSFRYTTSWVVSNANFTIDSNEFIGIIGPNGGGKTTLIKLLMGLKVPQKGSIEIADASPRSMRKKMSYVPQRRNFDPLFPISVMEVVLMGALSELTWFGRYPLHVKEKAADILKQLDLIDLIDRPFGQLSGGQMQRTLIARALLSDPEILLLDEPTASVDPLAEETLHQLLLELKGKMTILLVTHEIPGILPHVDRILCINQKVNFIEKDKVCSHFAVGLYHQEEKSS